MTEIYLHIDARRIILPRTRSCTAPADLTSVLLCQVPLLAAMKTMLEEADHPLAKMFLRSIRESAAIDDTVEQENNRKKRIEAMRPKKPLPDLRQPLSSAAPKKRAEVYSNPILSTAEEKD